MSIKLGINCYNFKIKCLVVIQVHGIFFFKFSIFWRKHLFGNSLGQKIIVGKISVGGWRRGPMFNLRIFFFCYIRPCNFLRKFPITPLLSIKTQNKQKIYGLVWLLETFWFFFYVKTLWAIWPPKGP